MSAWLLQHYEPVYAASGAAATLAGVAVLRYAWHQRRRHRGWVGLGWALSLGACWPWAQAAGFDAGPSTALVVLMLAGLAGVFANADRRRRGNGRDAPLRRADADLGVGAGLSASASASASADGGEPVRAGRAFVMRLLIAGPLAAFAALTAALGVFAYAGGVQADRLMAMALTVLILWSLGMVWACAAARPRTVAATLALAGTAGALALWPSL